MHINTPTINTDFYPTLLSLAGLGSESSQHIDGMDITPLFGISGGDDGEKIKALEARALFWHYPHYGNQGGRPCAAVRQNDYKLIKFFEEGNCELYDMNADISEARDLATEMPELAASMQKKRDGWLAETGAMIPERA
jgi:arylsulfatase A-like enzyme